MRTRLTAFAASLTFCLWPVQFPRPSAATTAPSPNTVYLFVEVETKVYSQGHRDQQRESFRAPLVLF